MKYRVDYSWVEHLSNSLYIEASSEAEAMRLFKIRANLVLQGEDDVDDELFNCGYAESDGIEDPKCRVTTKRTGYPEPWEDIE